MDNQNNNGKHMHSMMWMMIICCALPLAILLLGGTALFSGGYSWLILVGIAAFVCIGMMFRGHKHEESSDTHDHEMARHDTTNSAKKEDHSCCH